jgi:hypothetical protein
MRGFSLALACLLFWSAHAPGSQDDVAIQQDPPIECWPIDEFLLVHSLFVPPENVSSAKFYFRSTAFPDYYFVELALGPDPQAAIGAGEGRAIVPKAHPDTREVTFYLELLTHSFDAVRTVDRTVPVASGSECKRRQPAAAFFTDRNPNIAVHATRPGVVPLPPGFQAEGITSFVNAAGISGEAGAGGLSGKTIGIIAGAGGGAAAIALLAGGGSDTSSSVIVGATSTTTAPASTTTTSPGTTSSTTTSTGASTSAPTTSVPTTTNPTTSIATTSIATTSIPTTTTTSIAATADMSVTKTGSASAAVGQNFNYSVTVDNLGPSTGAGVRVTDTWTAGLASFVNASPSICSSTAANQVVCDLGSMTSAANPITIRLTLLATQRGTLTNTASVSLASPADPVSSNNSASAATRIALTDGPAAEMDLTYRSSIGVEPRNGQVRAQILVNGGSFQATDNSGDFAYTARAHDGVNRIETQLDVPAGSSGIWRFDFGASREFVSGSIRVELGQVLAQDGASIVFALGRRAPAPRFTFEVGEGRRSPPR